MLAKREAKLCEMEQKRRELQELSKQQHFKPSDEFTYTIVKSVKDVMAISTALLNSIEQEFLVYVNEVAAVVASLYGINETAKELIGRGGKVRVITDISYSTIELAQQLLEIGEEVRHYNRYSGIMFIVFDRKNSISAINADVKRVSLDEPLSALWTNDPTYANYLVSTFELLWQQSIPAAQQIQELLKEGPPHA